MNFDEVMARYYGVVCPWCSAGIGVCCVTRYTNNSIWPRIHSVRIIEYEDKLIESYIENNKDRFLFAGVREKVVHHKRKIRLED